MCTCRVKPRRLSGRWGFTRQPENSKRAHLRVPALQTPPKFHERTSREREREKKGANGSGRGKKEERNFGRSGGGRSCGRVPRRGFGVGWEGSKPPTQQQHNNNTTTTQPHENGLAKIGLAKVGHNPGADIPTVHEVLMDARFAWGPCASAYSCVASLD